jgi:hypothetical protein
MVAISRCSKSPAAAWQADRIGQLRCQTQVVLSSARNSSILSTRACAVGGTISHAAKAWHAQLRRCARAHCPSAWAAAWEANRTSFH